MEDNCKITVLFVVKCVRSLTPTDSGELLKFITFHPFSKPTACKPIQWNLDFNFLMGLFKMNVKSRE
jgi:hypothetical protein